MAGVVGEHAALAERAVDSLAGMPQVLAADEVRGDVGERKSRAPWWRLAIQVLRLG